MNNFMSTNFNALVVDDNEINVLVLENMLSVFHFNVDKALSGHCAIRMTCEENYDIIFVDHIMPGMNGLQTTEKIYNIYENQSKPVIIALTSQVTDEIVQGYKNVGADAVYEKPLVLVELIAIINRWFPELTEKAFPTIQNTYTSNEEQNIIKNILDEIQEINYTTGLKNAMGDIGKYMQMIRLAIKDIQTCINRLSKSSNKNIISDLSISIHNIKSVFASIGAIGLLEEANYMGKIIKQDDREAIHRQMNWFLNHIINFHIRIKGAVQQYDTLIDYYEYDTDDTCTMSEQEYEQCINNAIYYIKRFEYDAIISELEKIIKGQHSERKKEFIRIIENIKEFEYEKALARLLILYTPIREE